MFWCAQCKPCADGYPNHCEKLLEIGFSVDGAFAKYVAVDARYLWSLEGWDGTVRCSELLPPLLLSQKAPGAPGPRGS